MRNAPHGTTSSQQELTALSDWTPEQLLAELRQQRVILWLDNGQLRYRGPAGTGKSAALQAIRAHKDELIEYLRKQGPVQPLGSYPRTDPLPLSCMQRWWWELEKISGPTRHPLMVTPWTGPMDLATLRRCFSEILRRHESLRTRYLADGDAAIPVIDPPEECNIDINDLTALPESIRDDRAAAIADEYRLRTYTLDGGRLYRAAVIRIAAEVHVVMFGAHHITVDRWSMAIITYELRALYNAYRAGSPSPLAEPELQHADFALWEQQWLRSTNKDDPYAYWDERLASKQTVLLPTDSPRDSQLGSPEGLCTFTLRSETVAALRSLSEKQRATAQNILLAAYALQLACWSGETEVLFGNYTLSRTPSGLEAIVGCMGGNRPIQLTISPQVVVADYLADVRRAYVDSLDFSKPVSLRSSWSSRLNRVVTNFSKEADPPKLPAARTLPRGQPMPVYHDLMLGMVETPSGIGGAISFAARLFRLETIERFCSDLEALISTLAAQPHATLATVISARR